LVIVRSFSLNDDMKAALSEQSQRSMSPFEVEWYDVVWMSFAPKC
jgi:hypothetical protein